MSARKTAQARKRSGLFVYDPEKDSRGQEDALGRSGDGRTYLKGFEELIFETPDGDELRITPTHDGKGLEIRNNGRSFAHGLATIPHAGNVLIVRPYRD